MLIFYNNFILIRFYMWLVSWLVGHLVSLQLQPQRFKTTSNTNELTRTTTIIIISRRRKNILRNTIQFLRTIFKINLWHKLHIIVERFLSIKDKWDGYMYSYILSSNYIIIIIIIMIIIISSRRRRISTTQNNYNWNS